MKRLGIILGVCSLFLLSQPAAAQDFYGANFTGKHTWGVNVKYDGDLWVGTHYNNRRFGSFGGNALDFNLVAEVKIDKGFGGVAGDIGVAQVYADGNDFANSFGLGARYGVRGEFCPIVFNDSEDKSSCSSLSLDVALKPGYYANAYSVAAHVGTSPVKFYFGCNNVGYKKEADDTKNVDIRIFETVDVGVHADWTNALKGGGRYHLTIDAGNSFYTGVKSNAAWNTFYEGYDKTGDEDSEGACITPERNINLRMSHSMRF